MIACITAPSPETPNYSQESELYIAHLQQKTQTQRKRKLNQQTTRTNNHIHIAMNSFHTKQ